MEARHLSERRKRGERLFLWVMGAVLAVLLWQSYGVLLTGGAHE
jgi:hypothetical protein